MKTCEHSRHPIVSFFIYFVTGGALVVHMLSHLFPLVILFHSNILMTLIENPIITWTALLFIPITIFHLWNDRKNHKLIHKLTRERDAAQAHLKTMLNLK